MLHHERLLLLCRNRIEEKLGWKESHHWTNSDFETLSEKIFKETGVHLSTSTLKRVWGRMKYESVPQLATLNTLACFAGYKSFKELELTFSQVPDINKTEKVSKQESTPTVDKPHLYKTYTDASPKKRQISSGAIWSFGLLMGISLSFFIAFSLTIRQKKDKSVNEALYTFSSRPVAEGIPNSVVFTFNVAAAKTDCLYIQQTWDDRKRFKIKKEQTKATSIYYYPGYYKAKLVVDNQVVKNHDLYIKTKGWLSLVEQEPVPVYFTPQESIREGILSLSEQMLGSRNIALQPVAPWINYSYVQELGPISGNSFRLETGLKNTYRIGSAACGQSQIIVLCENTVLLIPLSISGCTSAINAYLAGKELKGEQMDLTGLGVDFTQWVKLRLEVKNKEVQVFVNEKLALKNNFTEETGKVIGIEYRFQGSGAVDYLHLYNEQGKQVYKEDFERKFN